MFRSAILRLTGWYLAIIMVVSLFFSVIVYESATMHLNAGVQRQTDIFEQVPRYDFNAFPNLRKLQNEQQLRTRQDLQRSLLLTNLVILLLGGAGSYFLAKRTLTPIEEALEAQSRFTADASHELRTPLTAMKSEIEVALRDRKLSSHDARQLLVSNLEEVEKLRALSDGLLKLARPGGENFQLLSARELIEASVARLEKPLQAAGAKVKTVVAGEKVVGDSDSLTELLVILIDNAVKYSGAKKAVEVRVTARKGSTTISVADQGQGIKASDVPYIFNRFYRADSSRSKEKVDGYGLGLSIAKQIVDIHHGHIHVESTPGHGSVFSVRLPNTLR